MNADNGIRLFDPIINSEDEMIKHAGLQNAKFLSYIYLRAYIMATLCFTKQLVVTDTAITLNRAFRSLIDKDEGDGYYFKDNEVHLRYPADFARLIKEGHIRVAARDTFSNFSDLYAETMEKKKHVDLPESPKYIELIDAICPPQYIEKYSIDKASENFSSLFRKEINKEINSTNVFYEREKLLRNLIYRLSDKETFTYNDVKSILIDDFNLNEKDAEYKFIRNKLRLSYDYNIPELLNLDCCMSLRNVKPSKNQDWKLDLSCKKLERDFICSVYGLASLPAGDLIKIWDSNEFTDFQEKLTCFRNNSIEPNEYIESLNSYILKINDTVKDSFSEKSNPGSLNKYGKIDRLKIKVNKYFKTDGKCFVILKLISDIYPALDFSSFISSAVTSKILTSVARKIDDLPEPPEKMDTAIIIRGESTD